MTSAIKLSLISGFILLFSQQLICQKTSYPSGGYATIEDFIQKKINLPDSFTVRKRSVKNLENNGGNDYAPESEVENISKKIKKELFAVSHNDTLYINSGKLGLQVWYSRVIVEGRYIVFKAAAPSKEFNKQVILAGLLYGTMGTIQAYDHSATARFTYVLNTSTKEINMFDKKYLEAILEEYPEIKRQFLEDSERKTLEMLLSYLKLVN